MHCNKFEKSSNKPTGIRVFSLYYADFCTEWPSALDSDEKCEQHFPIEIETTDYVSSGTSIRNPKARVVTLRVSSIFDKQPNSLFFFFFPKTLVQV